MWESDFVQRIHLTVQKNKQTNSNRNNRWHKVPVIKCYYLLSLHSLLLTLITLLTLLTLAPLLTPRHPSSPSFFTLLHPSSPLFTPFHPSSPPLPDFVHTFDFVRKSDELVATMFYVPLVSPFSCSSPQSFVPLCPIKKVSLLSSPLLSSPLLSSPLLSSPLLSLLSSPLLSSPLLSSPLLSSPLSSYIHI